jgi:hypothetical protein
VEQGRRHPEELHLRPDLSAEKVKLIHRDRYCFLRAYGDLWGSCTDHIYDLIQAGNLEAHHGARIITRGIRGSFCKFQKMRMGEDAEFAREFL